MLHNMYLLKLKKGCPVLELKNILWGKKIKLTVAVTAYIVVQLQVSLLLFLLLLNSKSWLWKWYNRKCYENVTFNEGLKLN